MPQTVKIGPHVYSIVRKSKRDMEDLGQCDFNNVQISIRKRLHLQKAMEVLVHEILHGCTYPSMAAVSNKTDEDFVDVTAPMLLQVLKDNPDLLAYLTQ